MIGNSSAGIRETSIYGVPAIDIGTRQNGRYSMDVSSNIQHVSEKKEDILDAVSKAASFRKKSRLFGDGSSAEKFMNVLCKDEIWGFDIQKHFVDLNSTM